MKRHLHRCCDVSDGHQLLTGSGYRSTRPATRPVPTAMASFKQAVTMLHHLGGDPPPWSEQFFRMHLHTLTHTFAGLTLLKLLKISLFIYKKIRLKKVILIF